MVITGASRGAGRATAMEMARQGSRVALVARSEGELREVAKQIERDGGEALVAPADVSDEASVQRMAEEVLSAFGTVDVLVNNAGTSYRGPVESMPLERWNDVLAVNLTGAFLCSRAFVPAMRRQGRGHIVNIASGAGKQGYPNIAAYSASKFGLIGFAEALAGEVGDAGIKVTTLVPGTIATGFGGRRPGERPAGVKMLEPEDVALAIVGLLRQSEYAWTQEMNLWPFK